MSDSQLPKPKSYEHYNPGRRKLYGKAQQNLMWQVYRMIALEGKSVEVVAREIGYAKSSVVRMYKRAHWAMQSADCFDPQAIDIRREMKKFLPLAAEALKHNLVKAEPRVTVAFLQGIGALVEKTEVSDITQQERDAQIMRTWNSMNPRLKEALNIEDATIVSCDNGCTANGTVERHTGGSAAEDPAQTVSPDTQAGAVEVPGMPEGDQPETDPGEGGEGTEKG